MSNIAFITTRKHIKSYNILDLFEQINQNKFGGKLKIIEISPDEIFSKPSWNIIYTSDKNGGLNFRVESAKKLASRHSMYTWWSYVMSVFHNEFGILTNGILSDESIEKHWAPVKDKHKSYTNYVDKFTNHYAGDLKDTEVKHYMASCPEEMRQY